VNQDHDSFLALTTDGINFLLSDQEICDVIKQSHNPTESAELITQQVTVALSELPLDCSGGLVNHRQSLPEFCSVQKS
jgi:hypothetical protein